MVHSALLLVSAAYLFCRSQRVQPIIVDAGVYLAGRNQFFLPVSNFLLALSDMIITIVSLP
jgi:hypothetical protein